MIESIPGDWREVIDGRLGPSESMA